MPDNRKPLIYGAFPVCRNYTVRAHVRDVIAKKRRGCADAFRNAGTFQRRIHPQHLCPLDAGYETECGRRDRKHHPQRDLKRETEAAAASCGRRSNVQNIRENRETRDVLSNKSQ